MTDETQPAVIDTSELLREGRRARGGDLWARKVRKKARDVAEAVEQGYVDLARLLYTIYDTPVDGNPDNPPIWRAWNYNSFYEYCDKELHLHYKRVDRLKRIGYRLEEGLKELPEDVYERLIAVGESKVRELVRVMTLSNAEAWVEMAEHSTCRELTGALSDYLDKVEAKRQEIEDARSLLKADAETGPASEDEELTHIFDGTDPDDHEPGRGEVISPPLDATSYEQLSKRTEAFVPKMFKLAREQLTVVTEALERASQLSGSGKPGHNLTLICTDFITTNDFTNKTKAKQRAHYLSLMEDSLGVRIIATDPHDASKVVFGIDTLAELAGDNVVEDD